MELGSIDGGEDGELNDVGFVEVSERFFGNISFERVYNHMWHAIWEQFISLCPAKLNCRVYLIDSTRLLLFMIIKSFVYTVLYIVT